MSKIIVLLFGLAWASLILLSWGGAAGQRMAQRSGAPAGLSDGAAWTTTQAEENDGYDSRFADHSGDHWFWRGLKRPDAADDTFEIALEMPASGTTGEVTVWLQGTESAPPNPDHHVRFSVNETYVGDAWWEGKKSGPQESCTH